MPVYCVAGGNGCPFVLGRPVAMPLGDIGVVGDSGLDSCSAAGGVSRGIKPFGEMTENGGLALHLVPRLTIRPTRRPAAAEHRIRPWRA
jgi:hypothetical protein